MCESVSSVCVSLANFIFTSNRNYCTAVSCNAGWCVCVFWSIYIYIHMTTWTLCLIRCSILGIYMPCEWILIRRRKLLVFIFQPICLTRTHTPANPLGHRIYRAHLQPERIIYHFCFNNSMSVTPSLTLYLSFSLSRPSSSISQTKQKTYRILRKYAFFFLSILDSDFLDLDASVRCWCTAIGEIHNTQENLQLSRVNALPRFFFSSQFSKICSISQHWTQNNTLFLELSEPKWKTKSVFFCSISILLAIVDQFGAPN